MYNPHEVTIKVVLPDGYYDELDDLTDDGRATIASVCEDADFELISIEQ